MDFCRSISELVTGSNLQGIHERYQAVLDILVNNQCSLTEAMRQFNIPHYTLRDYIGICELQIIDGERYKGVVEAQRQKMGKVSAKSIELRCRAVLNEYSSGQYIKTTKEAPSFLPKGGLLHLKVNVNVHTPSTKGFQIIPLHTTGNSNFFFILFFRNFDSRHPPPP